jgi:sulfur-oxidizing protein SoxY
MLERAMTEQAATTIGATKSRWNWVCVAVVAAALHLTPMWHSVAATANSQETWASLAAQIFKGRPLTDGSSLVGIEMPARAQDAAIVPVTMRITLPQGDARRLKTLTLVIDENPAPVAATFKFGDNPGITEISTRVRVNSYTNVHAVAELSDGKLYVVKSYVKASGGCSAPASKNADEAIASLGQMKFRLFDKPTDGPVKCAA